MGKKSSKVSDINRAISRSSFAVERGYKAELLPDGRTQYSKTFTSGTGRKYQGKISFNEMLGGLHGEDIRALSKKYGKRR